MLAFFEHTGVQKVISQATIVSAVYDEASYVYKVELIVYDEKRTIYVNEHEDNIKDLQDFLRSGSVIIYQGVEINGKVVVDDISFLGASC